MASFVPAATRNQDQGGFLEAQLRTRAPISSGWSLAVRRSYFPRANTGDTSQHSGSSHSRNPWSEPVRGKYAGKAGSRSSATLIARSDRPRIEAKPRIASLRCEYSFSPGTALGAVECPFATRGGESLHSRFAD